MLKALQKENTHDAAFKLDCFVLDIAIDNPLRRKAQAHDHRMERQLQDWECFN
jgi:hypothetical protein